MAEENIGLTKAKLANFVRSGKATIKNVAGKKSDVWKNFGTIMLDGQMVAGKYACRECYTIYKSDKTGSTKALRSHKCNKTSSSSIQLPIDHEVSDYYTFCFHFKHKILLNYYCIYTRSTVDH